MEDDLLLTLGLSMLLFYQFTLDLKAFPHALEQKASIRGYVMPIYSN